MVRRHFSNLKDAAQVAPKFLKIDASIGEGCSK
jgi:hypothetical protein